MRTCITCGSEEVICGEPEENLFGEITILYSCLDCGETWEEDAEEND